MSPRDRYGLPLSTGPDAAAAYVRGVDALLGLRTGSAGALASSIVLDPTFALGHAALALVGHDLCVEVDVVGRMRDAERWAHLGSEREQSHVAAVLAHLRGDARPLLSHLTRYPVDAVLLAAAVPSLTFAGVLGSPAQAHSLVEAAAPAYGADGWYAGLLASVRHEQGRADEALELADRALAEQPDAGHAVHARAHVHLDRGEHRAGLAWLDTWLDGPGAGAEDRSHFAWHAAMHELALGDLDAVRRRYEAQLRPELVSGCRALVDTGSLLVRWSLTPGVDDVPDLDRVAQRVGRDGLVRPSTPFLGLHAAALLLALEDAAGLAELTSWARAHGHPAQREVVAPLARALSLLLAGRTVAAAHLLDAVAATAGRLGGSDAQRELVDELRVAVWTRADRADQAAGVLDLRLARRPSARDEAWRRSCRTSDGPLLVGAV